MIVFVWRIAAAISTIASFWLRGESNRLSNLRFSEESNLRCVLPSGHTEEVLAAESGYNEKVVRVVLSGPTNNYTATICGQGIMTFPDFPWKSDEYRDCITSVVISNYYYTNNPGTKYRSEIETIQAHAFSECKKLESLEFVEGKGMMFIDRYAFANCTSFWRLGLTDSMFGYGSFSFYHCRIRSWNNYRRSWYTQSGIECFGESCFEDAFDQLKGLTNFGSSIGFGKNSWRGANIGKFTEETSGYQKWSGSGCGSTAVADEWVHSVEKLIDDDNITSNTRDILIALAAEARSVIAVTGVIEEGAFRDSNIRKIILSRIREIQAHAFSWCPNLKEIHINDGYFIHRDAFVASPSITTIVYCGKTLVTLSGGTVILPRGVTSVTLANTKITVFGDKVTKAADEVCNLNIRCTMFWPVTHTFTASSHGYSRSLGHRVLALATFCDLY